MSNFKATFKSGSVEGDIDMMHGCCGVGVIHSLKFLPHKKLEALFEEFYAWLLQKPFTENASDHFGRALYCMTDSEEGSIREFCAHTRWKSTGQILNHRSGNQIRLFWLDRRQEQRESVPKENRRRAPQREDRERPGRVTPGSVIGAVGEARERAERADRHTSRVSVARKPLLRKGGFRHTEY